MDNKSLKHFILGLLTGMVFVPIIEEFQNVIMSWIQVMLLKPSKLVIKGNKEIAELQGDEEPIQTNCIGFQIPSSNDYEEDDEFKGESIMHSPILV